MKYVELMNFTIYNMYTLYHITHSHSRVFLNYLLILFFYPSSHHFLALGFMYHLCVPHIYYPNVLVVYTSIFCNILNLTFQGYL